MKRIIYIFDSATSLLSLSQIDYFKDKEKYNIEIIGIIDDSIKINIDPYIHFDRLYIIKSKKEYNNPCLLDYNDLIQQTQNEFIQKEHVAIISYGEFTALVAAKLRDKFKISGATIKDANLFRNKVEMKRCVSKNAKVPKCYNFDFSQYYKNKKITLINSVKL